MAFEHDDIDNTEKCNELEKRLRLEMKEKLNEFRRQQELEYREKQKELERELQRKLQRQSSTELPESMIDNNGYERASGVANMTGELYEVKMVALLYLRVLNRFHISREDFHISSSMKAAGAFDDMVLTVGGRTVLIQLKHRENMDKEIEKKHLVKEKGNFSLSKYFKSYCEVKSKWAVNEDLKLCGNFEDALFIVYTNATMSGNSGGNLCNSEWYDILGTGGRKCMQFTSETCQLNDSEIDLADYDQFLSQLMFFTEEAAEDKLDDFIRPEIKTACGSDTAYIQLIAKVQEWWRDSSLYLTIRTHFWWDIVQSYIANLSKKKIKMFENLNLKFREEHLEQIRAALPTTGDLHVVAKDTVGCIVLTSLKVHQILCAERHLFVDGNMLNTHRSEIEALWGKWCDLLVVVEDGNTPVNFIHSHPGKRLVYISGNKLTGVKISEVLHEDEPSLTQLDEESKRCVLDAPVLFQGYRVSLQDVIGCNEQLVSADVIVQALTKKFELGETLAGDLDCYIPRTMHPVYQVKEEIMCHSSEDSSFKLAVSGKEVEVSSNIETVHNKEEFRKLADKCDTVHWIHWDGNAFVWKESKGQMMVLLDYLTEKSTSGCVVDSVLDIEQRVVLVSDNPGMGKSTLLTHVARRTKQQCPVMWVFKVNLNSFTDQLAELPDNLQLSHVIEFLLVVSGISLEWKSLFQDMKNVSILFDGFDEISPTHTNKVIHMLKLLQNSNIEKLWVSTRPVTALLLQQELCVLPWAIRPFSTEDQNRFLAQFWMRRVPHIKESFLNEFITDLLRLTAENFGDRKREFMGIPLLSMLLAEAFTENLTRDSKSHDKKLPRKFAMFQLYTWFVDQKLKIYCHRNNLILSRPPVQRDYVKMKKKFIDNHMIASLMLLLPEDVSKLPNAEYMIKSFNTFVSDIKNGIENTAIITQIVNSKPVFLHRTFAEYFTALWFADNFAQVNDYLKDKLDDRNFQMIKIFFDRILAQEFHLHVSVLNHDYVSFREILSEQKQRVNETDKGGRTALHLAVMSHLDCPGDASGFITDLLRNNADFTIEDNVFCWTPLRLAERIKAWSYVNLLLESGADDGDMVVTRHNLKNENYMQDMLGVAAAQGLLSLVKFMLQCDVDVEHPVLVKRGLFSKPACHATMLHVAAEHGHFNMVQFLVENGADVNATDHEYTRTALMWAATTGQLEIVQFLAAQHADINACDKWGNTALQLASQCGELNVFKFLVQHADMPNNVMHCAAESGNIDLVGHLLNSGQEVDSRNDYQETPLWRAAWFGQLKVVELLCNHDADLNVQCSMYSKSCGLAYTPLHAAVRGGHSVRGDHFKVVQCLVQHGANLFIKDSCGRTPLDVSQWFKGNEDISEFLHQETILSERSRK